MSKIIGIDLGTTNSCVSIIENGNPKIIINKEGQLTTPSVVAYKADGSILVGGSAVRQLVQNKKNTFYSIKRLMGKAYNDEDVQLYSKDFGFDIVKNENGDVWLSLDNGILKAPQQISADILIYLKAAAETYLGESVSKAVVTVPAYFNDAQRKATADAVKIAGLDLVRMINEPTAAALAYGFTKRVENKNIVIYDLGGGTFDVSVININKEDDATGTDVSILATSGNSNLGGDDFDICIVNYLLEDFKKQHNIDLQSNLDGDIFYVFREAAIIAKKELSFQHETEINLPHIYVDSKHYPYSTKLLRSTVEDLVKDLVKSTLGPLEKALVDSKLKISDIDDVILVGGQTRMPCVEDCVKKFFNKQPRRDVNPDEVVSIGASTLCGILEGDVQGVVLCDVVPISLGTKNKDGKFIKLISKGSPLPKEVYHLFTTVENNQKHVEIDVFQGEDPIASNNEKIASFDLPISALKAGSIEIQVGFSVDINGIINVHAKETISGREQKIKIESKYGLTEKEVNKMFSEAVLTKQEQAERFKVVRIKNESINLIKEVNKLVEAKEFAQHAPHITSLTKKLDDSFVSNDFNIIEASFLELLTAIIKLFGEK